MIIKKIHLVNYRSHSDSCYEFSRGINLIIGKNGRGKSSILEAIGKMLFSITLRNGKEKGLNFIKYGENNSVIEIEFLANDGKLYNIKGEFSKAKNKSDKYILTNEDGLKLTSYSEISQKIVEICGLKNFEKDIYENIIVAKQNEFIEAFKLTAAKRIEIFDNIFNTYIYREMYEKIFKNICDIYQKETDKKLSEKESIIGMLEDVQELEKNFSILSERYQEIDSKINQLKIFSEETNNKIKNYEKLKNNLQNLEKELEKNTQAKISHEKYKAEYFKDFAASEIALEKTKKSEENYKKYDTNLNNIKEKREVLMALNVIDKENNNIKNDIKLAETRMDNFEKKIKEYETTFLEKEKNMKEFIDKQKKINAKIIEKNNLLVSYEKFLEEINPLEDRIIELNKEKEKYKDIIEIKYKEIENLNEKKNKMDIQEVEIFLENKSVILEKADLLEQERTKKMLKKETLEEAETKLSKKFCPLLMENCKNLDDKDVLNYFSKEINSLDFEIENIEIALKKTEEETEKLKKYENIKNEYSICCLQINEMEKYIQETQKMISQNNEVLEDKEEIKKEKLKSLNYINKTKILGVKDLKDEIEILKSEKNILNFENKNLEESIISLEKEVDEIKSKIKKSRKEIETNKKEIDEKKNKIREDVKKKIEKLEVEIAALDEKNIVYKNDYDIYMSNIELANKNNDIKEKIENCKKNIETVNSNMIILNEKINYNKEERKKYDIVALENNYLKIKDEIEILSSEKGSKEEAIKNINKKIEEENRKKEKVKDIERQIKKNNTKLEKSKKLREKMKTMGPLISKYTLQKISVLATQNFNKITGRDENIYWSNDLKENKTNETEGYQVYLIGRNNKKIPFDELSGGEQVAVGISIRATLNQYFTNAKFIILDEPTNNLDNERKKLLSEYMNEILSTLEQSIIVTHDNTFREMAEKIIEV